MFSSKAELIFALNERVRTLVHESWEMYVPEFSIVLFSLPRSHSSVKIALRGVETARGDDAE